MHSRLLELCVLFSIYFSISYVILNFLYDIQPGPLIDEVFHIPQGIKYCHGNFSEWDPKITTLPGLYIVSFAVLRISEFFMNSPLCNTYNLRLINVVCSSLSFCLLYCITSTNSAAEKRPMSNKLVLWTAINISLLPISFFFNFFYYTDTMSTLFFLLMYKMHLSKNFWIAAVTGFCSVLIRQTNIIWVGYMLLDLVNEIATIVLTRNRKSPPTDISTLFLVFKNVGYDKKIAHRVFQMLRAAAGYFLVCILFVLFLCINKGIVVGDRNAHKPVLHICQIFYFSLFSVFFCFPHYIGKIKHFISLLNNNKMYSLMVLVIGLFIVCSNTLVHPYLLADNRHYSFYLWKRVFEKHVIFKYLLLPLYFFGLYCLNQSLKSDMKTEFWLCTLLCLVPQKLLEFRYFLLPFILYRLQLKCKKWWHLSLESMFYISLNALTIYIFVTKEFYWSDSQEIQRIIW